MLIPVLLEVPYLVIHPIQKKNTKLKNLTLGQLEFCQIFPKYIRNFYMTKYMLISIIFSFLKHHKKKNNFCFCKGYDAQHCLLVVIEKMKEIFHCFKHDILIKALHAFGFHYKSLRILYAYLNNRLQVTKVSSHYSEIIGIMFGVPQR